MFLMGDTMKYSPKKKLFDKFGKLFISLLHFLNTVDTIPVRWLMQMKTLIFLAVEGKIRTLQVDSVLIEDYQNAPSQQGSLDPLCGCNVNM